MLKMALFKLSLALAGTYLSLVAPDPNSNACRWVETDPKEYLFEVYLKTPKLDNTGDFGWKDAKAASMRGKMLLTDYVIGGVEPELVLRTYWFIRALSALGYEVGITSAFRDDYRQALIAKGMRANIGYSFHGGSLRGGWGHGLAIDFVALAPTRQEQEEKNEALWKAIDRWGPRFGLGRPYGERDGGHTAPLSSPEFSLAAHPHHERARLAHHHHHHRATHKKIRVARK